MSIIITEVKKRFKELIPKSWICFKEGYRLNDFYKDLCAGVCVGVIAIPLALAFAIASGVDPEKGLYTAIVAGFLISLLGGSRVQIGGPTGAFVILVYSIVSRFGYSGLAAATCIAAFLLVIMGIARFGLLLKFIPSPVIVGFTTGIACVIFSSQIKDFFGLSIETLPPAFFQKWKTYFQCFHTINLSATTLACATLLTIILLKRFTPRLPGAMIAIVATTLITQLFDLPVETIGSRYGEIPRSLPTPSLPFFSFKLFIDLFPSAFTIAMLAAIESLLSASIADGLTGTRHRSNCELVAQGVANFGSIIFGGIPATGAIARTTANIELGGKTPLAGIIHAITIFVLMLFLAPCVSLIPLAALAAILVYVSWTMSELPHFIELLKGLKGDAFPLTLTFILTLIFDLTIAIQAGVLLAAIIFLKRMTDKTSLRIVLELQEESHNQIPRIHDENPVFQQPLPSEITVFEINGPFFYSVSHLLEEALQQLTTLPKIFILSLHKTPLIDATGLQALKRFHHTCKQHHILLFVAGAQPGLFRKSHFVDKLGPENLFPTLQEAVTVAKSQLALPATTPTTQLQTLS